MNKEKKGQIVTTTTLVVNLLSSADDFRTAEEIAKQVQRTPKQVWAALVWLRRAHVVDCVIQGISRNGHPQSYWFRLPLQEDAREYVIDVYTPTLRGPRRKPVRVKPKQNIKG